MGVWGDEREDESLESMGKHGWNRPKRRLEVGRM